MWRRLWGEIGWARPAALASFQRAVRDVVEALPDLRSVSDPKTLRSHLDAAYKKTLQPQLDDLRGRLRGLGIDTVLSALDVKVAVPGLLATGVGASVLSALHPNPLVIGTGALVLSLVPLVRRHRTQAAMAMSGSPAAYLLHAGEALEPAQLSTLVERQWRRFVPPLGSWRGDS